ncbi:acyltransferase [Acidovorax sp. JG5]|uniref:acyltransferase family protein n=1 Tax=Acidovorax sp. JG5 TaxID=2822718 RepID=UPI001B33C834|nr:acyltransferase [Acidovorax sp. JG5]MBP3981946.1 acyltransferase [Acidovorax sp. JG5]
MQIDKASSERLTTLRFPLIIGVVFIHAYNTEVGFSNGVIGIDNTGYWVNFCRNLISQGMARVAVPLFFLISGYFFFIGFSFSAKNYKTKLKSRLKTLLIPFLFWNILTLFLIALAQHIPTTQSFFSGKNASISKFEIFDYFNAVFGIDRSPISYQFWFIRDLIVMVLIAPAIYFLLNKASKIVLLVLFSLWLLSAWPIYIPSVTAFLFFMPVLTSHIQTPTYLH